MIGLVVQFLSSTNPQGQVAGSNISLQHALIMMLILVGMLSICKMQSRYVHWFVLLGLALSLFIPYQNLDFAWPIISALVLPPLLWQISVRLATARLMFKWEASFSLVLL